MLKKILITLSLVTVCVGSNACNVNYSTASTHVNASFEGRNGWEFANYDAICEKLLKANAQLYIVGYSTVLSGRSIAWADISLADKNLPIVTNSFGRANTKVNETASMDTARKMLFEAINEAIPAMEIDKAIIALNKARQEVRTSYTKIK